MRGTPPEPEFIRTWTRTAQKTHECDRCGRLIRPGEEYRRTTCLCEGVFSTEKVHGWDCFDPVECTPKDRNSDE